MMVTRTELINEMERERRRRKLNHQDFSTLLKISKSYWCMIRKGTRRPTLYVLQTILHQVPQLGVYVDSYMRQENDGDKEKRGQEIINPGNSEKPPSKTGGKNRET